MEESVKKFPTSEKEKTKIDSGLRSASSFFLSLSFFQSTSPSLPPRWPRLLGASSSLLAGECRQLLHASKNVRGHAARPLRARLDCEGVDVVDVDDVSCRRRRRRAAASLFAHRRPCRRRRRRALAGFPSR